ncbi:MAG: hypothetical protein WA421_12740 [Nitrososphaeraceae archaeon]
MTKIKLLFTCPHVGLNDDGTTTNPPIIKRDKTHFPPDNICPAEEGEGFNNINDSLTRRLTEKIVENITKLNGNDPYAVYAEFNRRWIDYNRKEICAFDVTESSPNPKAQEKYQAYHNEILQRIEEMLPQGDNSMAFLFDIHGTDREKSPDDDFIELIVGTDQTNSRKALTDDDFWDNDNGLIPLLCNTKNIRAYPKNLSQEMTKFTLDGGYTIKEYGSKRIKPGLVAIQIEVINCIRDNRYCREKFAADMADCILKFVHPFIPI